jgi:replicative DNA helicase
MSAKLSQTIQEALLALLCFNKETASVVAEIMPADLFDPVHREIATRAVDYLEAYGEPPGEHTLDIFEDVKEDSDRAGLYERLYGSLLETNGTINPEYVLDQATKFAKRQKMKRSMATALRALQRDTPEGLLEAESLLAKSLESTATLFDSGTDIFGNPQKVMRFLDQRWESFPTDIPQLDLAGLGPARKRLSLFVGPAKAGKSWWLVHLAKAAQRRGLNVLYVTLELSEAEVSGRMMQSMFAMAKRKVDVGYFKFKNGTKEWTNLGIVKEHFQREDIRRLLDKKIKRHGDESRLIVREFPTGRLTVKELSAYLDVLEAREGFVPDLVLVDHLSLMTLPNQQEHRHALGALGVGLRGLAVERSLAVATAAQANRAASGQKRRDATAIAEDYSLIGTADTTIVYNQTDDERKYGLARLYVAAGRTDEDKFEILISQAYAIGQFCLDSSLMTDMTDTQADHDD